MSSKTISPKAWHTLTQKAIAEQMGVDAKRGLNKAEVEQRLRQYGPNVLSKAKKEPLWHAFLRQYKDYIAIVLTAAAVASLLIGDVTTGVALFILTFFNASQGLQQERRAEKGVAAISKLMQDKALVRRDGQVVEIVSEEIVPGDICLLEAGDRIPADGRLLIAASLEVDESALTGESAPVLKDTASIEKVETPLGDRLNMGYMNCNVTRGRGELLVTTTGMKTEMGHIAEMLHDIKDEKSPLTKQVDGLTLIITIMAVISLIFIVIIGFSYGYSFNELFVLGITLAIAAIPTGLPIIVTSILAIGSTEMVKLGAIIKRLPYVETMGSISAICTDKTGTLTLNQMTARELVIAGHKYSVTGEGYDSQGKILHTAGVDDINLDPILLPMVLCSDAVIKEGELVGDPTEGALVVLAQKGGIMVDETREEFPRIAEVPFDSAYKLMATFHKMSNAHGEPKIRCYVKGALDVLISRSVTFRGSDGLAKPLDEKSCLQAFKINEQLASQGMRIIAVAERTLDPDTFNSESNLLNEVNNLTLLGMVGIVDPPRPEVKPAIGKCLSAGIQVRMVTGDHPATATAIADELGIKGQTITGAEFSQMSDQEVINKVDDIGVIARVAPEDKVRLVRVLKEKNKIVAMTGDGVNDAPALKMADIGIAMGITGTDVSKESAVMILTDDNFATIVRSVEYGRTIYDNLLKFIRFQMAGLFGFILAFLGSAAFGVTLILFNPLQILFVNFLIQAPIAASLAYDTPTPGLMKCKPRQADEKILSTSMMIRLLIVGAVAALFTILAYQWTISTTGSTETAQTMAMVIFSLTHIPFTLGLRHPFNVVFRAETLSNRRLLLACGWVVLIVILVTELRLLQGVFGTVALAPQLWVICLIVVVGFLLSSEVIKLILKLTTNRFQ